MSKTNQTGILRVLSVLLALFAIATIWLLVNQANLKKQLTGQINEISIAKDDLEKEYNEAITSLEDARSENMEINTLIDEQKAELEKSKTRINGLLKSHKDLALAKEEIAKMRVQAENYLVEITNLKAQNEELFASNQVLSEEKTVLTENLNTVQIKNEELSQQKTMLSQAKMSLEAEKRVLSDKVTRASVLDVKEFEVTPVMLKGEGKVRKKKNASKVDRLDVCFDVIPNEIAEYGDETYYLRVIDPEGVTMSNESLGSGTIKSNVDNSEIPYSISGTFQYDGSSKEVCMQWLPGIEFAEGDYMVEVYNKGYICGSGAISLR